MYTYRKLKDEILQFIDDLKAGIHTYELINWGRTHPRVSVHGYDSRYKIFANHCTPHNTNITLLYWKGSSFTSNS